jgi:hypothetical protein
MICSSLYNHSKCMASYLRYVIAGDGHFRTLVLACSERQLLKMQFHTREGLSSCWKVLRRATGWSSPQMSILIGPMTWWYDDTWYYLILLDVSCHITTKLVFDFFVYHMGVPTKKKSSFATLPLLYHQPVPIHIITIVHPSSTASCLPWASSSLATQIHQNCRDKGSQRACYWNVDPSSHFSTSKHIQTYPNHLRSGRKFWANQKCKAPPPWTLSARIGEWKGQAWTGGGPLFTRIWLEYARTHSLWEFFYRQNHHVPRQKRLWQKRIAASGRTDQCVVQVFLYVPLKAPCESCDRVWGSR